MSSINTVSTVEGPAAVHNGKDMVSDDAPQSQSDHHFCLPRPPPPPASYHFESGELLHVMYLIGLDLKALIFVRCQLTPAPCRQNAFRLCLRLLRLDGQRCDLRA